MLTEKSDVAETLKIGDYVTFRQLKFDGLFGAEGILQEDLGITFSEVGILDDALFAIHLKRQYSASREYEDFMASKTDVSAGADKYLSALRRGKFNERKLNDHYMRTRLRESVKFGDTVQLFHVKSGKYLRVYPDKLAKDERQNLLVQLDASGDMYSWISILPRFKIDRLGDPVQSGTEVYLGVAERANEFIHCSERDPLAGRLREVNCSLEASSWKMTIFQTVADAIDAQTSNLVLAYHIVYLNDPEQLCNLSLALPEVESLDGAEDDGEPKTARSASEDGPKYLHDSGDLILEPMVDSVINSRMLWFIEADTYHKGGSIKWKTSKVRFRHVNTEKYLIILSQTVLDEDGDEVQKYSITTCTDPSDTRTLFNINEINSPRKLLSLDRPLTVGQDKIFFERGAVLDGFRFALQCTNDKSSAINFKLFRYNEEIPTGGDDSEESKQSEPLEIFSGLSLRASLNKYFEMTVLPQNSFVSTIWPNADRNDVDFFNGIMDRAVFFSQGFPISATNIRLDVDKAPDKLRFRRQNLLRDQGVLEVLLRLIHKLKFVSNKEDDAPKLSKAAKTSTEEEQILLAMGKHILEKCFTIVLWSIRENPDNQMYVADQMTVLLAHLGGQPLAGKCVTEMLASNMELQETKIGTREIAIFVEKLRSSKMNAMYLQLLKACCSCQGSGVDGNQCKVTDLLYSNTADVIIQLHADHARPVSINWTYGLYVTPEPVPGCPMLGDTMVAKGIPRLSLAWTTNSIDFSPLGLFGKLSVGVEELYAPPVLMLETKGAKSNKSQDKKKNASMAQKAAVASYFVSQMMLGAEMCMDRNYIAFHTLDEYFPYEVLVSILKMNVTEDIKAAAARLILCLHVDRDPQAETKIPGFTRTWTDLMKGQGCEPKLPYVEPARRHIYGLIQQEISEHVAGMAGRQWTELSRYMLQLLKKMILFNFYGTNERMRDVIGPLVLALDRRNVAPAVDLTLARLGSQTNLGQSTSNLALEGGNNSLIDMGASEEGLAGGDDSKQQFYSDLLDVMEGIPMMVFIMLLVLAGIAALIYETVSGATTAPGDALFIFTIVLDFIFSVEIITRAYCFIKVRGSLLTFFKSILNIIDVAVIAIDIVFLSLPTNGSTSGRYLKALRLVRLIRLLRILRAARVINVVVSNVNKKKTVTSLWQIPVRYSKCPQHELQTMIESVEILQISQKIIEDRNLTLLLNYFYAWEAGTETRSPSEIFNQTIEDSKELSLGINDFDHVMVDVLMFISSELVQSSLEILMAYHSTKRALLTNAQQVQLLVASKRERQFKIVDQMLQQLEQNAETHELWGELATEADESTSKQTKDIMKELLDICRVRCSFVEFDTDHRPDPQIQDLLRNLGCFGICMKVLGLLDSVEEDENGELDDVGANTRNLCLICNELLYWFILDNPQNQEMAFEEFDFFIESLDSSVNSHLIIRAIFCGNERLMRTVPHTYLTKMMEKICKVPHDERSPYDLELMYSISSVKGIHGIKENQVEIMKHLTSPGRVHDVISYFVPIASHEYEAKKELMAPFIDDINVPISNLPKQLQYHILLLDVLSGLTVGKVGGITAIEAKLQSIYNYFDCIDALLDEGTPLIIKIKLAEYLFNGVIEVELKVPGLEYTAKTWKLLSSIDETLTTAAQDFAHMRRVGLWHKSVVRRKLEYHLVCIMIYGGFLTTYFDKAEFSLEDIATSSETVTMTTEEAVGLLVSICKKVDELYRTVETSGFLSPIHQTMIIETLRVAKQVAGPHTVYDSPIEAVEDAIPPVAEDDDEPGRRREAAVCTKYQEFIDALNNDEDIQRAADTENTEFIAVLESLPFITDDVQSDIRQETLFKKLVTNIRENLTYVNNERRLDPRLTKTATWIIKAFRTMIENRMGMTIYERDEDGGLEQDIAVAPVISALNACGATTLCLDLISVGIDPELQLEAIKLGVGMLFKEGGATEVQKIFNNHLNTTESHYFFRQVRATIHNLIDWHKVRGIVVLKDGEEPSLPENSLIVRFIQLMAEGHFLPNQDVVRVQTNNVVSINLLDDFVEYLEVLSRLHCRTSTTAAIQVAATILEVIQGPCKMNQNHLVMKTELVETLNRLMRGIVVLDCVNDDEVEMKKTGVDIFQGLLEGQPLTSAVYERVLNVIHLDIILQLSGHGLTNADKAKRIMTEAEDILETECIVLLQILCDCKPSLRGELGLPTSIEEIDDEDTACLEIIWNNELNRRFFHVPKICQFMSKSSMDTIVQDVDRSTLENKLTDFLERSHELYREIKHHEFLLKYNLTGIFSKKNFDRSTWFSFFLAILINVIFITSYTAVGGTEPHIDESVIGAVNALNILQIMTSCFNLVVSIVVINPVRYQTYLSVGYSPWNALLYTSIAPMNLYYFGYLMFSIFGVVIADYFLTFLLLDIIVKNTITKNVLMSVYQPRRQLMYICILVVFLVYIYSFFLFVFFREHVSSPVPDPTTELNCFSLWNCFKLSLVYGLRQAGGAGDVFDNTLGERWVLDASFFLIILIVVLNLVYGIIIMTFSVLRSEKADRDADTQNICFICGIDRAEFDRASEKGNGFKLHIKFDHNMWNYVRFMIFLWEQDRDDDDGLEQYVRRAIAANDLNWFPMNKAIRLESARSNDVNLVKALKERVKETDKSLSSRLAVVQSEVTIVLEQVAQALKQEHMGANNETDELLFIPSTIKRSQESLDDGSVSDMIEFDPLTKPKSNVKASKPIYLELSSISGTETTDPSNLFCTANVEGKVVTLLGQSVVDDIVHFHPQRVLVSKHATFEDTQIFRIRVFKKLILSDGLSVGEAVDELIGYADFSYSELSFADGLCIDKYFVSIRGPKYFTMSVFTTSIGQISFA